jgi:polygalacturonase
MLLPARLALLAALLAGTPLLASYDVRAYGAKADGATNDAAAINRAIAAASDAGGGTVEFAAGDYLSGSVHLRSNVTLHLGPGASLVASSENADYDLPEPNEWGDARKYQDFGHSHWHDSLIWGEGLENIAITGPGRIYGRGLSRGWDTEHPAQHVGNKAIALRNCRHVLLRDFTIRHGGWFGLLATGVDNLTIDNLLVDTPRDGFDIDCCHNVRVSNCSVNSPWDDAICLKSSFGLGQFRSTENVTISDCLVCGYDEGTLLDGTRQHRDAHNPDPTGRIKFGTESNGGFKAVTITNCVFECCRGLALESADGALLEDVTVSNLAMREIYGAPIFLRLGERMRGPDGTPVGKLRHVLISNVVAEDVRHAQGILITGVPGHPVEDVTLVNVNIQFAGGGGAELAHRELPEMERSYPEPLSFGPTPAWALVVRHAEGVILRDVAFRRAGEDRRSVVYLQDVHGIRLEDLRFPPAGAEAPAYQLRDVTGLAAWHATGLGDTP